MNNLPDTRYTPRPDRTLPHPARRRGIVHRWEGLTLPTSLLAVAISMNAMADDAVPNDHDTHRSQEASVLDATQQGLMLSRPALPDPARVLFHDPETGTEAHGTQWYMQESWITDVGLLLLGDQDHDGYYTGFSLSVDADTSWSQTDVYLTLSLQPPWSLPEALHTSAVFPLYAQSLADEYRIDIELVRNYSSEHRDLIMELRDAWDGRILDTVDAAVFSNLRALPLESEEMDQDSFLPEEPIAEPVVVNDDIRVEEHAGSIGLAFSLALLLPLLYQRRRQRSVSGLQHHPLTR